MTDNGGERRDSGSGDSWFKPSENRYLKQSEYEDPLEGEEAEETVFPDSGGYTGLSSSRPALVEPYPEALGGPPPSNGISYPGAGASAYQPLTRIPGESEEPSLPSVAASARVPLPEEPAEDGREDSWSDDGPRTQEIPVLGAWDSSGGAEAAPADPDEHGADSEVPAWGAPESAAPPADQPWDGGTRAWDGDVPAAAPGDGAAGGQPWDDGPGSWPSPAPETPGPEEFGGQPWDDGPGAWDTPSDPGHGPGSGDVDGSTRWDTAGGRPWDGDELGFPARDADAPAGGAGEPGAGGRDTAWDAPSSAYGTSDPSGTETAGGRSWDNTWEQGSPSWNEGSGAWSPTGTSAPGERSWDADDPLGGGEARERSWDADDPLGGGGARGRSWDADELGASSWGTDETAAATTGTDDLDAWTPPREGEDGWAGSGANEPWTAGHGDELSSPAPGQGSGNTWVFGRDDPRMPDVVREAEQRRRESAAERPGASGWEGPDTGELSAAVPASDDPLAAIADMQTRARSRSGETDEEPGEATGMFDVREGDWDDLRDPGYGRARDEGEAGYEGGSDELGYAPVRDELGYGGGPDGYGYAPARDGRGYEGGSDELGYAPVRDELGYDAGPGEPGYAPVRDELGHEGGPDGYGYAPARDGRGYEGGSDELGYAPVRDELGYDGGPDGYGYAPAPEEPGYDTGPDELGYAPAQGGRGYEGGSDELGYAPVRDELGYDAGPDEPGYAPAPEGPEYDDGPEEPGYDAGTQESEYDDGFTPADYGMSEAPAGRRRRRDPIAGDFPGFDDRPLGGDAGDPYPGYDNIDFLADTERGAVITLWLGVASLLPGVGLATALVALLVTGPKAKKEIRESRGQLDGLGLITVGTVFAVLGILVTVISVAIWLIL
ncbi:MULTISPECIES: hypothetical protein [Nocardiopsis]|uniref:DUF4190 domain-containing protein n=1 Tax=Nocardiopsis sinuspersici TaxID=501010 RepID=A0A1V3C879_9ACTN|nr:MULTISPECIES: hypothetical protein [Nocardiopsis]OOC56716.1 hypothetical protein NOSIN_25165 [Nocardiopsis sinuspersici]